MPCTTILVGKCASNDGSTMIARTDDGHFDVKKMTVATPQKKYKSVIGHLTIDLPEDGMRYTCCPSVDATNGIWAATGINEANVAMTATETITSNARVLGADPMVRYKKAENRREKDIPGGIGEEDFVVLVLPYIRSAREGVIRLGSLLEKYGTYESNGIAFSDENEIWWLETIGGHHWMAKRVPDAECVVMPNRFGMDSFDFDDAAREGRENLCSADLEAFIKENHLDLSNGDSFNPRYCFGSRTDSDRIYNTPRAWFMGRYLCPNEYVWEGSDPDFTPESMDIPWSFIPEKKVTVEDVKYLLSSHYQGTPYNPYSNSGDKRRGMYRTIGINRTGVTCLCQLRPDKKDAIKAIQWVAFGSTTFDAMIPVYTNVDTLPKYLTDVSTDVSSENFYWASRLIGALADPSYDKSVIHVENYQTVVACESRELINKYDRIYEESGDEKVLASANEEICKMAKKYTGTVLANVLRETSEKMKNGFNRFDN